MLLISVYLLFYVNIIVLLVYVIGDWLVFFGIVFVVDRFFVLLVLLISLLGVVIVFYSCVGDDKKGSFFYLLVYFLILGVNGVFLIGDVFNLFVFFEVLLIVFYLLLMYVGDKYKI